MTYTPPPLSILEKVESDTSSISQKYIDAIAKKIIKALAAINITCLVNYLHSGPKVSTFNLQIDPIKEMNRLSWIEQELTHALSINSVRILETNEPVSYIIEVENEKLKWVYLKSLLELEEFQNQKSSLTFPLGVDTKCELIIMDLAENHHLFIRGMTGSGQDLTINSMICSMLLNHSPDDVKFLMMDPKLLALSVYDGIPHLLAPVISDLRNMMTCLKWAIEETERRTESMKRLNIDDFSEFRITTKTNIPYIVIVIDELSDLIVQSKNETEEVLVRLAQKCHTVGIHIVIATSCPDVHVITTTLKDHFINRIGFQASSTRDSITFLGSLGAERLLGLDDGLFLSTAESSIQRFHAPFIPDHDISKIVSYLKEKEKPYYDRELIRDLGIVDNIQLTYTPPPLSILKLVKTGTSSVSQKDIEATAKAIAKILTAINIQCDIEHLHSGPTVSTFKLQMDAISAEKRLSWINETLTRALNVESIRILYDKETADYLIEVPTEKRGTVYLRNVLESKAYEEHKGNLTFPIGVDTKGDPVIIGLEEVPHLLIGGCTGSGKSVAINSIICSILLKYSPDDIMFLMIDPKMLELSVYKGIPNLITTVTTDIRVAVKNLKAVLFEMEWRLSKMKSLGTDSFIELREKSCKEEYFIIVIDELSDLMIQAGNEAEPALVKLAKNGHKVGIHIIMATSRPSVDVFTKPLLDTFSYKVGFHTSSTIDSKTILNTSGAEKMILMGDGLFLNPDKTLLQRFQAPFVSDDEVNQIVSHLNKQETSNNYHGFMHNLGTSNSLDSEPNFDDNSEPDELYEASTEKVVKVQKVSASMIQRHFKIGYNRAARIVEMMEKDGIISEPNLCGKRSVLKPRLDHTYKS
jgi:DNA segregation ATPase FtsK/SpoIIIE-like protein